MEHTTLSEDETIAAIQAELADSRRQTQRRVRELTALKNGARAVLRGGEFARVARAIFDHCKDLIGATSGYVAMLREDGAENEVLFLEAGGLPCDVDPLLPMPIRGLRAEAYRDGRTVYENDFMNSRWAAFMPPGHVVLKNVLFAPLHVDGRMVGVMGLANKAVDFDANDAEMAASFGELAAIALQNSRAVEERKRSDEARERLIEELKASLAKVRTLSGLLPICAHCKQIRNDQGYWERIETYIQQHSDAEFSHGLCPDCARKLYPELKLDSLK